MNGHNIQMRYQAYQQAQDAVEHRREAWRKRVRDHLRQALQTIVRENGIAAEVRHEAELRNMEAVMLDFGRKPSGIYEVVSPDAQLPLIKDHGALGYGQIYNGKISAWIRYPLLDNIMEEQPPKILGVYEPDEITEAHILRHLEEALTELTEWEDQDLERHPIGFNRKEE